MQQRIKGWLYTNVSLEETENADNGLKIEKLPTEKNRDLQCHVVSALKAVVWATDKVHSNNESDE